MNHNDRTIPPSILSWEFHTSFFPRLLWSRLNPKKDSEEGTSFNHNMGLTVSVALFLGLGAIGFPMIIGGHPFVGWALAILGLAGILFIFINSIAAQPGLRPTYEDFHLWTFFFLVCLGFTGGLFLGSVNHEPHLFVLAAGLLGILPGYG